MSPEPWRCDAHHLQVPGGDCPKCDAELIALAEQAADPWPESVGHGAAAEIATSDPFVAISTALDAVRPDLVGTELQTWRRVTKVCEESGEVWRALSGYVAENPRKGQTHTLDDLRGELLDTASAALCAWVHLNGNTGDPLAALLTHVGATAERLQAALAGPVDWDSPTWGGGTHEAAWAPDGTHDDNAQDD